MTMNELLVASSVQGRVCMFLCGIRLGFKILGNASIKMSSTHSVNAV